MTNVATQSLILRGQFVHVFGELSGVVSKTVEGVHAYPTWVTISTQTKLL
ncbi:hypothetical protein QEZ47_02320 [Aminobacter anthyllidis]|nr:hypothetical protein [Aminobacter anthyllidis]MDH4984415.1 hypothetical protein [Aminobacter anthyllidis]